MKLKPFCFKLKNKYVWDLWFLKDQKGTWFKYFLEAPRTKDPENRHFLSSIGLATSKDLVNWDYKGTILSANPKKWDDTSIWTGSTFFYNKRYYLFYTSRNSKKPNEQLIGLITSKYPDFRNYIRVSDEEPLLKIDPTKYEINSYDGMTHFRDPFVFEEDSKFYMVFCSRKREGDIKTRGVVGVATSSNLINWEIQEPLNMPNWFDNTECPYIIKKNNLYYLHFCSNSFPDNFKELSGVQSIPGDYYLISKNLRGPYRSTEKGPALFNSNIQKIAYNTRIISERSGKYLFFWQKENDEFCEPYTHKGPYKVWYNNNNIVIDEEV